MKADILLITVTDIEARAVLEWVEQKTGRVPSAHYPGVQTYYDLGEIGGARTLMVRSEMGSGGAGGALLTVSDAINELTPAALIMVGLAFGVDPDKQSIGDILVSQQICPYEHQRVGTAQRVFRKGKPAIVLRADRPSAPIRILNRFRDGVLFWEGQKVRFGPVLSGEKLVDNINYRDQLRRFAPEAIGGEMEGAGLYAAAYRRNVDWIVAKGICDWADGKKGVDKRERQELASRNAAHFALFVLQRGGFSVSRQGNMEEAIEALEQAADAFFQLARNPETGDAWRSTANARRLGQVVQDVSHGIDFVELSAQAFGEFRNSEALEYSQLVTLGDAERVQPIPTALDYAPKSKEEPRSVSSEEAERIRRALERIQEDFGSVAGARAARLLESLPRQPGRTKERIRDQALGEGPAWLRRWPDQRPEDDAAVLQWVHMVGLKFNPFGPEKAELDPLLPLFRVADPFADMRGRRSVLVFGEPGSGKTAASLLLALESTGRVDNARDPGIFPVTGFIPSFEASPDRIRRHHLTAMTRAIAKETGHYLARHGQSLLRLPRGRRYNVVRLLSLWHSPLERLIAELQGIGPASGADDRLIDEVKRLYQAASPEDMTELDYLDLLYNARLAGFGYTYLLTDPPEDTTLPDAAVVKRSLCSLFDLIDPLATSGVYLKLFLPSYLSDHLGDLSAYKVFHLAWNDDQLADMLNARIRSAGGDSLMALCGPDVLREPSLDERLVRAANNYPRQLVHLGNELLREHVRRSPGKALFSAREIDLVLGLPEGVS